MTGVVLAALYRSHRNLPEERIEVVDPRALALARLLDKHLGSTVASARFFHFSGRMDHYWLELTMADGDKWVMHPEIGSDIYWERTDAEDEFRAVYTGKDTATFAAVDEAARESMSNWRLLAHPYRDDDTPDMGWDLFG